MFNFCFMTKKKKLELRDELIAEAFEIYKHEMEKDLIPELKRLKKDHWDKDAFDRLIDKYSK